MKNNPFTPNFGQVPPHIAGRERIIDEVIGSLKDSGMNPARTSIFVGARGAGKTALLSFFGEQCKQYGWISANVTCIDGLQRDILLQARKAAEEFLESNKRKKLKGVSLGQVVSLQWDEEPMDASNWRIKISEIIEALEKQGIGLLITIDEVNPRLNEMVQVAAVYQHLIREGKKVALLMAGLPSEVSSLLNNRSVSFLWRASRYELGRVSDGDVSEAFVRTIEDAGGSITQKALNKSVEAIEGFPNMLQLVGYRSWQHAKKNRIGESETDIGIAEAKRDFDDRVLKATLSSLSEGDMAFVYAMLPDEGLSMISDIEERMEKSPSYVSRYRGRLIEQGVIEPAGRGKIVFALPGLKEYLMNS